MHPRNKLLWLTAAACLWPVLTCAEPVSDEALPAVPPPPHTKKGLLTLDSLEKELPPPAPLPPPLAPAATPAPAPATIPVPAHVSPPAHPAVPVAPTSDVSPPAEKGALPPVVTTTTPAEGVKVTSVTTAGDEWRGSLMFLPADIERLRKFADAYRGNKEALKELEGGNDMGAYLDDLLKGQEAKSDGVTYTFPYFYLGSIAYHGANDWTIWVNNRRITAQNQHLLRVLTVKQVTAKYAIFEWKPSNLMEIPEHAEGRNNIAIDAQTRVVEFTLRPNQTFYSKTMTVSEGRAIPNAPAAATYPAAPAPAKAPASAPAPATPAAPADTPVAAPSMPSAPLPAENEPKPQP